MWRFAKREGGGDRHAALNLFENLSTPRTALKFEVSACVSVKSAAAATMAAPATAAAATPGSAAAVGPTRKTLFRKSGDEFLAAAEPLDADEKVSQTDKALVEEMLTSLRDEVKEMDRTNWLYETQDPQVAMRVKV